MSENPGAAPYEPHSKPEASKKSNSNRNRRGRYYGRRPPKKGPKGPQGQPDRARDVFASLDLRERLAKQLGDGTLECLVCLERVRPTHSTWDCSNCFQIFHIHCIKKWSRSNQQTDGQWRCPAGCGECFKKVPREYRCFCKKVKDPEYDRREIPHSCGEVCAKQRKCVHTCMDLCHPGPCPDCTANINLTCPCGKSSKMGRCGTEVDCQEICGKALNCQIHQCQQKCHKGDCGPCDTVIQQVCHCGKTQREEICTEDTSGVTTFECQEVCGKSLDCLKHSCQALCHAGPCQPCQWKPELIHTCPCGQTTLDKIQERDGVSPRTSCTDPIATCGLVCQKKLHCGPVGANHRCQAQCHSGPCPECPETSDVRCRCGFMDKELACRELKSRADDVRCDKRCTKKRSCGRHKCNQPCCIDIDHVCPLTCGKLLSCGSHRCDEPCHKGNCFSCPNVSFDELTCHCGAQVMYPPIACGTKAPGCSNICIRIHSCSHEVMHACHSEDICPPCTALTDRECYGKHEVRKNVPCHIEGLSCGRPCNRALDCGRHRCIRPCHDGLCLKEEEECKQLCTKPRETCGHACNAPCHDGVCPSIACRDKIKVSCPCGNLKAIRTCAEQSAAEARRAQLNSIALTSSDDSSITLPTLGKLKTCSLECNEECAKLERNRRLALALQIENPDMAQKLSPPTYSEFMKDWVRKDVNFVQMVHDRLVELVKMAKESKQKSRSFSFDCMKRDKRQFIHEYSDFFGVDSESCDPEPNRNVVITAYKDKVFMPSQPLIDVVMNKRRAPGPVTLKSSSSCSNGLVSLQTMNRTPSAPSVNPWTARSSSKTIDYFDDD